jgi:hypothetical protein
MNVRHVGWLFRWRERVLNSISGLLPRGVSVSIEACSDATGGVLGYAESVGKETSPGRKHSERR